MEIQYLLNYSYMIFLFGSINWFWKQKKITNIDRLFQGLLIVYLSIIFLSLITGTSSATYLDGTGEKSWFLSGNSLGASLSLLYFANLIILNKQNWKLQSILLLGTAIFMMFFLGSRVGLYGILLLTICYLLIQLFFSCRDWLFAHKGLVITGFILFFVSSLFLGKTLLIRQRNLDAIANQTIDPLTGEIAHVTGDTIQIVKEIQAGTMENMKEERQSAYLTLYKQANHYQVKNTDRRTQQLIYHTIFFQKNKDPFLFLFGNGYLNHHGELVLEMETIALFYNFGILGFILFFGLFLSFFLIGMKQLKSQILKGNASYCLFLFGILFAILLSTFTGYVYFNPTTALIIILMNISLFAVERKTI